MGKIGIVVVTYNRKELLVKFLESINKQSYKPNLVIIVDNNSTDGTKDLLIEKGFLKNYKENGYKYYDELIETNNDVEYEFYKVKYIKLKCNLGGSYGFYLGIKIAICEGIDYIWVFDDDCELEKNALNEIVKYIKSNDNKKYIYSSIAVDKKNNNLICWPTISKNRKKVITTVEEWFEEFGEYPYSIFIGGCFPKEAILECGLPVNDYFIYCDDTEYYLRMNKKGWKFIGVKESIVFHPIGKLKYKKLLNKYIIIPEAPPWKFYYSIRNSILNRKIYWKYSFLSIIIFIMKNIFFRPNNNKAYWKALLFGIRDGLFNIKGKQHQNYSL